VRRAEMGFRKTTRHTTVAILAAVLTTCACESSRSGIKMYDGVGVVVSIDRNTRTIEIDHDDIKGFMTAMTMPFKANRPSLLDNISPGDKVEFKLRDDGSEVLLVKISKKLPDS